MANGPEQVSLCENLGVTICCSSRLERTEVITSRPDSVPLSSPTVFWHLVFLSLVLHEVPLVYFPYLKSTSTTALDIKNSLQQNLFLFHFFSIRDLIKIMCNCGAATVPSKRAGAVQPALRAPALSQPLVSPSSSSLHSHIPVFCPLNPLHPCTLFFHTREQRQRVFNSFSVISSLER